MLRTLFLVGFGGALGSMLRYAISIYSNKLFTQHFPFATFSINIIGCFLIGLLFGLGQRHQFLQGDVWLVLATGFCGGFTTFSAFALENINLLEKQHSFVSLCYSLLSVVLGIAFCRLGIWLME
ncbi:MAG TPA: fluoride efflux transporter CrcB [Flavipsychrobacter sp.]|nr:fluoride efflux transporter CrcB [Flavipsychrobacter sp.]